MFNVYYKSPGEIELIVSFEIKQLAIDYANNPGSYWSRKLAMDADACVEVTNGKTGEIVFYTLIENGS